MSHMHIYTHTNTHADLGRTGPEWKRNGNKVQNVYTDVVLFHHAMKYLHISHY